MSERLSAWVDGELKRRQRARLLRQLGTDVALRKKWDRYHLIGDALRGVYGPDLGPELNIRLGGERIVPVAPRFGSDWLLHSPRVQIAAGILAVVFAGGIWIAVPALHQDMARSGDQINAPQEAAALPERDVNAYLFVHQGYSPSDEIQGVMPYVRTVEWVERDNRCHSGPQADTTLNSEICSQ